MTRIITPIVCLNQQASTHSCVVRVLLALALLAAAGRGPALALLVDDEARPALTLVPLEAHQIRELEFVVGLRRVRGRSYDTTGRVNEGGWVWLGGYQGQQKVGMWPR